MPVTRSSHDGDGNLPREGGTVHAIPPPSAPVRRASRQRAVAARPPATPNTPRLRIPVVDDVGVDIEQVDEEGEGGGHASLAPGAAPLSVPTKSKARYNLASLVVISAGVVAIITIVLWGLVFNPAPTGGPSSPTMLDRGNMGSGSGDGLDLAASSLHFTNSRGDPRVCPPPFFEGTADEGYTSGGDGVNNTLPSSLAWRPAQIITIVDYVIDAHNAEDHASIESLRMRFRGTQDIYHWQGLSVHSDIVGMSCVVRSQSAMIERKTGRVRGLAWDVSGLISGVETEVWHQYGGSAGADITKDIRMAIRPRHAYTWSNTSSTAARCLPWNTATSIYPFSPTNPRSYRQSYWKDVFARGKLLLHGVAENALTPLRPAVIVITNCPDRSDTACLERGHRIVEWESVSDSHHCCPQNFNTRSCNESAAIAAAAAAASVTNLLGGGSTASVSVPYINAEPNLAPESTRIIVRSPSIGMLMLTGTMQEISIRARSASADLDAFITGVANGDSVDRVLVQGGWCTSPGCGRLLIFLLVLSTFGGLLAILVALGSLMAMLYRFIFNPSSWGGDKDVECPCFGTGNPRHTAIGSTDEMEMPLVPPRRTTSLAAISDRWGEGLTHPGAGGEAVHLSMSTHSGDEDENGRGGGAAASAVRPAPPPPTPTGVALT